MQGLRQRRTRSLGSGLLTTVLLGLLGFGTHASATTTPALAASEPPGTVTLASELSTEPMVFTPVARTDAGLVFTLGWPHGQQSWLRADNGTLTQLPDVAPAGAACTDVVSWTGLPDTPTVHWVDTTTGSSGSDRYGTSSAISAATYPTGVPVVFLASGENFPDALTGAPVAAAAGGPLLLTPSSSLPAAIRDELARLSPHRLVVLGGVGVIDHNVVNQAASYLR